MTRFLFLIPLLLSLAWLAYLQLNGWTIKQGLKGFAYIAAFSAVIAIFYTVLMWVTGK